MIAGYARTSSQSQADTNGTKAQRHEIDLWAAARGITPVWYVDEAKSGKSMDRPEFNRLMADMRAGKVKAIVAYSLSRLGRTVRGLLDLVDEARTRGVQIVLVKDQIDTETPMGRFFLTIMSAIAELERETIRERVSSGLRAKGATGARWGRNSPKVGYAQVLAAVEQHGSKYAAARALNVHFTTVFRVLKAGNTGTRPVCSTV